MTDDGVRELLAVLRTGGGEAVSDPTLRAVETEDPDVARRWRSVDEETPRQVVTAYRPRLAEPASYPPDLPFVPAVRVFVTETDARPGQPGARWLVEDDSDVVADVVHAMIDEGWVQEPARTSDFPLAGLRMVLRREDEARLLVEARLDDERRVVQLLPLA